MLIERSDPVTNQKKMIRQPNVRKRELGVWQLKDADQSESTINNLFIELRMLFCFSSYFLSPVSL